MPNKCGFDKLHEWMADPRNMLVFFVAVLVLVIAYLGFLFLAVGEAVNTIAPNTPQTLEDSRRPTEAPSRGLGVEREAKVVTATFYTVDDCDKLPRHPAYGITASGTKAKVGRTIAAGPSVPFGTKVFIPGFGWRVVEDRGGAIGDDDIDVLVSTRAEAFELGRKPIRVYVER
jgi:3D (Asp-Asp-Asp) domain-containing protein